MGIRNDGREPDQLRPLAFTRDYTELAMGSVLVEMGRTRVLCTASVEERVPPWLRGQSQHGYNGPDETWLLPLRANVQNPTSDRTSARGHGRDASRGLSCRLREEDAPAECRFLIRERSDHDASAG